jgi:hypothetical protein
MVVYEEIYNSSNHKHITYHYALFDRESKFGVLDLITCLVMGKFMVKSPNFTPSSSYTIIFVIQTT